MHRRELLTTFATAGAAATATMASGERSIEQALAADDSAPTPRPHRAPFIASHDGTNLYWREWGHGAPLLFLNSIGLGTEMWDYQMVAFAEQGFRCIGLDRRGHGRSTQTIQGHDMDTYAADVAELVAVLDLKDAIHIGHSTGGGEVTRYVARYGKGRVSKAVLISAIPMGASSKVRRNRSSLSRSAFSARARSAASCSSKALALASSAVRRSTLDSNSA